jgi:hypothetical protein
VLNTRVVVNGQNIQTLSGAAFMKMEAQEIAALSRDELVRLAFRGRAIAAAIATYIESTKTQANFDIRAEAEVLNMKPQDIAALSKDELEGLVLHSQEALDRCPFKPGCRFVLAHNNVLSQHTFSL